ncbi:MAG: type II toxin-antitoxin system VapC family toxin [Stellaceae bacterium]
MIVVDSSALIAILFEEPERQAFQNIIAAGDRCVMSAVNAHETATVLRLKRGPVAVERFWQLLADSEIEIIPFDEAQVRAAAVAFDRYGKGIHSKAQLNLSDCAAYALAKTMNAPLLFKGDDFTHTDLQSCLSK